VGDIRKAIENKCAKAGFTLTKQAMDFFMETCGKGVESAMQEFNKIELWADTGQEINLENCQRLIWGETESKIFDISDGILEKNPTKALKALQTLFAGGEEGYSIAGTLIYTFRNFHAYLSLSQEKIPNNEWKNYATIPPFAIHKCKSAAQRLSLESTKTAFSLMSQADADLKGGKSEPKLVIERLVLDLCRI
jgi:DNA polymerase-3 subunit delta